MRASRGGRGKEILERARRGDGTALEHLVHGHRPLLLHWVWRWMRGRGRGIHDPEDVVQEALTSACRALHEVREPSPKTFRSWMRRIAQNRLRDVVRRQERARLSAAPERGLAAGASAPLAEGKKDWTDEALGGLGTMRDEERLILVLRDVLGTTWRVTSLLIDGSTERVARRRYGKARHRYDLGSVRRTRGGAARG